MVLKHLDNFTRKSPSTQLSNGSSLLTQETCCWCGPSLCNTSTQLSGESCLLQEPRHLGQGEVGLQVLAM